MGNLNIAIVVDTTAAEKSLKRFERQIIRSVENAKKFMKSMGLGPEYFKEIKKASRAVQSIEKDIKRVVRTTRQISQITKEGFSTVRKEVAKTKKSFVGLGWSMKSILTDATTLANFQLRWYLPRQALRGASAGISFKAELDESRALLERYGALENELTERYKSDVGELITYSRSLATHMPIAFGEIVKAADRLLAAGANIDTVRASLKEFAQLQVAFPEIEMEKFTTALVGFLNTFRKTPGLRELENDAERLEVLMDKISKALAIGVIAPGDINVLIQHFGQMSQAAGFTVDEMLALSVMVTNLGKKAGPAGRALRGLIDSLSSKKGIESLKSIGIELDKNKTIAEQFKTVIEGLRDVTGKGEQGLTFGAMEFLRGVAPTQRRDVVLALIREMEQYEDIVDRVADSQGALDRTSAVMTDTLKGQWQMMKNISLELISVAGSSEFLRDSLKLLIGALKAVGYVLSGIVGIFSLLMDGFSALGDMVNKILTPVYQSVIGIGKATSLAISGDFKGAWKELKKEMLDIPDIQGEYIKRWKGTLKNALPKAAKEIIDIQNVLFGMPEASGGKDKPSPGLSGSLKGLPEFSKNAKEVNSILKRIYQSESRIAALDIKSKYISENAELKRRQSLLKSQLKMERRSLTDYYRERERLIKDSTTLSLYQHSKETVARLAAKKQELADLEKIKGMDTVVHGNKIKLLQSEMDEILKQGEVKEQQSKKIKAAKLQQLEIEKQLQAFVVADKQLDYTKQLIEARKQLAEITGDYARVKELETQVIQTNYEKQIEAINKQIEALRVYRDEYRDIIDLLQNLKVALGEVSEEEQLAIERMKTPLGAFKAGLDEATKHWNDTSQQWKSIGQATAQSLKTSFSSLFFDFFSGDLAKQNAAVKQQMQELSNEYDRGGMSVDEYNQKMNELKDNLKGVSDYMLQFVRSILKSITDMMSEQIAKGILDWIKDVTQGKQQDDATNKSAVSSTLGLAVANKTLETSIYSLAASYKALAVAKMFAGIAVGSLGGVAGTGHSYETLPAVAGMTAHQGGLIMHDGGFIEQAKRFHSGGLNYDERPAILQTGEYVVSRRGVQALDRINQGGITNPNVSVEINIENKSSSQVSAKKGPMKFDGKKIVQSIILEDLGSNGPIRQALQGNSRL